MKLILKKINPHDPDQVFCQEVLDEYYTGPIPLEGHIVGGRETSGKVKNVLWNFVQREITIEIV